MFAQPIDLSIAISRFRFSSFVVCSLPHAHTRISQHIQAINHPVSNVAALVPRRGTVGGTLCHGDRRQTDRRCDLGGARGSRHLGRSMRGFLHVQLRRLDEGTPPRRGERPRIRGTTRIFENTRGLTCSLTRNAKGQSAACRQVVVFAHVHRDRRRQPGGSARDR